MYILQLVSHILSAQNLRNTCLPYVFILRIFHHPVAMQSAGTRFAKPLGPILIMCILITREQIGLGVGGYIKLARSSIPKACWQGGEIIQVQITFKLPNYGQCYWQAIHNTLHFCILDNRHQF